MERMLLEGIRRRQSARAAFSDAMRQPNFERVSQLETKNDHQRAQHDMSNGRAAYNPNANPEKKRQRNNWNEDQYIEAPRQHCAERDANHSKTNRSRSEHSLPLNLAFPDAFLVPRRFYYWRIFEQELI
jgi:hypothetical protein